MNLVRSTLVIGFFVGAMSSDSNAQPGSHRALARPPTSHKTVPIDGLDIFYREAGPMSAPVLLLLHGFPTSSHMFRNLIPALSDRCRLIVPDSTTERRVHRQHIENGFGEPASPIVETRR